MAESKKPCAGEGPQPLIRIADAIKPNILLTRAGGVVWWWMVGWVNTMLDAIRGGCGCATLFPERSLLNEVMFSCLGESRCRRMKQPLPLLIIRRFKAIKIAPQSPRPRRQGQLGCLRSADGGVLGARVFPAHGRRLPDVGAAAEDFPPRRTFEDRFSLEPKRALLHPTRQRIRRPHAGTDADEMIPPEGDEMKPPPSLIYFCKDRPQNLSSMVRS